MARLSSYSHSFQSPRSVVLWLVWDESNHRAVDEDDTLHVPVLSTLRSVVFETRSSLVSEIKTV